MSGEQTLQELVVEKVLDLCLFMHNNIILPSCGSPDETNEAQENYKRVKGVISSLHANQAAEAAAIFCGRRLKDDERERLFKAATSKDIDEVAKTVEWLTMETGVYDQLGAYLKSILTSVVAGPLDKALSERSFAKSLIEACHQFAKQQDQSLSSHVKDEFWEKLIFCVRAINYIEQ